MSKLTHGTKHKKAIPTGPGHPDAPPKTPSTQSSDLLELSKELVMVTKQLASAVEQLAPQRSAIASRPPAPPAEKVLAPSQQGSKLEVKEVHEM